MNFGALGQVGDIGMIVGSVIGIGIAAIVLLTFGPGIVGDIDNIGLNGTNRCVSNGEQFRWLLVAPAAATNGADAWAEQSAGTTGYSIVKVSQKSGATTCQNDTVIAKDAKLFTPKGNPHTAISTSAEVAADTAITGSEWKKANRSLTALSGGSIALLLFSAAAILVPAGGIGFLSYFGARFLAENIGGGVLSIAIGATVIVVLAGAILPEVFDPLDDLFLAIDGNRFWVYSVGIGKLGPIIGQFLGIAILGGIVNLGMLLWKGHGNSGAMSNAM